MRVSDSGAVGVDGAGVVRGWSVVDRGWNDDGASIPEARSPPS